MQRILITRAVQQASSLAEALRARGFDPLPIAAIEIAAPASFCGLDAALACLPAYDWLVLTSANAVESFALRMRTLGVLPAVPRVAAIGPATARAVREWLQVEADLVPATAVAESLAEALLQFAWRADGSAARFLLVRAETARDLLPEALIAAGAEVTLATAYRTIIPPGSLIAIREVFASRKHFPDAITFTSSSTVSNLLALAAAAGVAFPANVPRISIGPITSKTLAEAGLPPHAEAAYATVDALADAVAHYLR